MWFGSGAWVGYYGENSLIPAANSSWAKVGAFGPSDGLVIVPINFHLGLVWLVFSPSYHADSAGPQALPKSTIPRFPASFVLNSLLKPTTPGFLFFFCGYGDPMGEMLLTPERTTSAVKALPTI